MGERIPQVCIICGEDAPVVAQESFWAPVIPEIRPLLTFLGPISGKPRFFVKETVQTVPYCKQHEYELDRIARRAILLHIGAALIGAATFGVVCGLTYWLGGEASFVDAIVAMILMMFTLKTIVVCMPWLKTIYAHRIDGRMVTLRNVSPAFVSALTTLRRETLAETAEDSSCEAPDAAASNDSPEDFLKQLGDGSNA
jgi:hypothetical protein